MEAITTLRLEYNYISPDLVYSQPTVGMSYDMG